MISSIFSIGVLTALGLSTVIFAEDLPIRSICDVLHDPSKLNGKLIAVRGYEFSTDEGVFLKGNCKDSLETQGVTWPNLISLAYPGGSFALHEVDFTVDRDAIAAASDLVRRYKEPKRVWLTYVGLLETREPFNLQVYTDKSGKKRPAGFGNGAVAPAQLLIKTVKDVVVEKLPQSGH
jgi:hypothetical protein